MDKVEWKLVPVEPTPEMIHGAWIDGVTKDGIVRIYRGALAAAPTPPAQEAEPVSEAEALKGGRWINADDVDRLVRELDVLINGEAGAAKQAKLCDIVGQVAEMKRQEAEPVAYAYASSEHSLPSVYFAKMDFFPPSLKEIPLHTHPANDKLRRAAEEVKQVLFGMDFNDSKIKTCYRKLCAALEGK